MPQDTAQLKQYTEFMQHLTVDGRVIPWIDMDSTPSTMEIAHAIVRDGRRETTLISANCQTSGRGTKGRSWSSLPGKGVWLSVILPPPDDLDNLSGLTVAVAEELIRTLRLYADCPFTIKDPNDVLVNGRKIAGILVETSIVADDVRSVLLGMGMNFTQTREDFLRDNLPDATSLILENGTVPSREEFIKTFMTFLLKRYDIMIRS
ncbi:biotin--[acetyl-CoA-carboxylase] ligase [Candidatus Latescibacterota bacterium]